MFPKPVLRSGKPMCHLPILYHMAARVVAGGIDLVWVDPASGEVHRDGVSVSVLGASGMIYAGACASPGWPTARTRSACKDLAGPYPTAGTSP